MKKFDRIVFFFLNFILNIKISSDLNPIKLKYK